MNTTGRTLNDPLIRRLTEDLEHRYARGESGRVEDYLDSFPELKSSRDDLIEMICVEWQLRTQRGDVPTAEELTARFGDVRAAVLRRMSSRAESDDQAESHDSRRDPYSTVRGQSTVERPDLDFAEPVEFGPYRIVRELGRGGMGVVYEAQDTRDKSRVALKTLRLDRMGSLLRFKNEFRILQNLTHDHLVRMLDLDTSAPQPFFTMELIEGQTFLDYARAGFDSSLANAAAPFDEQRLRRGILQLAKGLQALHDAGKLHRDIKPTNVIVRRSDECVVLLDFGLAVDVADDAAYRTIHVAGTLRYMAPEQERGDAYPASDWFSVGVILFETLTGGTPASLQARGVPLSGEPCDPRSYNTSVPADLAELCAALLRPRPADRPGGLEIIRRLSADEV